MMEWLDWVVAAVGQSVAACLPAQTLRLHDRQLRVVLLAEGGFSFVFRAEEVGTGRVYALKRMTCLDDATVQEALHEIETGGGAPTLPLSRTGPHDTHQLYKKLRHPNLIECIDSAVEAATIGPNAKEVYMLLPYYSRGTVQQAIDQWYGPRAPNVFSEAEILNIFRGVCRGVHAMHHYKPAGADAEEPLAHRDIKPANVLLADDGHPVLMDFGSATPARIKVTGRHHAMLLMDVAAQRCTMPYRPPELFDLASDLALDERTDIWVSWLGRGWVCCPGKSLGCLLYAMAYGRSPFELSAEEGPSGSIALSVISGHVRFPRQDLFSPDFRSLIQFMLVVDPGRRPTIDDVRRRLGDTSTV